MVHGGLKVVLSLNPMAGVIVGFRSALLRTGNIDGQSLFISGAVTAVGLVSGLFYFRRMEQTFADVV
jgi:lipopolysaccharide transport system permease protein